MSSSGVGSKSPEWGKITPSNADRSGGNLGISRAAAAHVNQTRPTQAVEEKAENMEMDKALNGKISELESAIKQSANPDAAERLRMRLEVNKQAQIALWQE